MLTHSNASSAANTPRRRHIAGSTVPSTAAAANTTTASFSTTPQHHHGFVESTATSIIRRYGYLKHGYEHLPEQYLCPCCGGGAAADGGDGDGAASSADILRDRARGPGLKFGNGGGYGDASSRLSCNNKTCMNYTQLGLSKIAAANKAAPKYDVSLLPPMTVDALRSRQAKEERIQSNAQCTLTVIVHKLSKDVPLGGGGGRGNGNGDGHVSILVRRGNFEGMTTLKRSIYSSSSAAGTPRHGSAKKKAHKLTWNEKFDLPFDAVSDDALELFVLVGGVQSEREGGTLGLARVDDEALHSASRGYREKVPITLSSPSTTSTPTSNTAGGHRRGGAAPPQVRSGGGGYVEVSWCLHSPPTSTPPGGQVDTGAAALSSKRDAAAQRGVDHRRPSSSTIGDDDDDESGISGGGVCNRSQHHSDDPTTTSTIPLNANGQPLRRIHSVHLDILRCVVSDTTTTTPAAASPTSPRSTSSPTNGGGGDSGGTTTRPPLSPTDSTGHTITSPNGVGRGGASHNFPSTSATAHGVGGSSSSLTPNNINNRRAPSSQQFSSSSGCVLGGGGSGGSGQHYSNTYQDGSPSLLSTVSGGGGAMYFTLEGVDGECSDAAALFPKKQVTSLRTNTTKTLFLPTVAVDGDSTGLIGLEVLTADEFVDFDEVSGGYTATTRPVRSIDHVASTLRAVCGVANFGHTGRTWSNNNNNTINNANPAVDRQAQLLCCRRRADGDGDLPTTTSSPRNGRSPRDAAVSRTSTTTSHGNNGEDVIDGDEDAPLVLDVVGAVDTSHLWESVLEAVREHQLHMPNNTKHDNNTHTNNNHTNNTTSTTNNTNATPTSTTANATTGRMGGSTHPSGGAYGGGDTEAGGAPIRVTVTLPLISVADESIGEVGGRVIGEVKVRAWTTTEVYHEPHTYIVDDDDDDVEATRNYDGDNTNNLDDEENDRHHHDAHDAHNESGLVNHDDAITALGEDSTKYNNNAAADIDGDANNDGDQEKPEPLLLALTVMRGVGLVDGRTRQPLFNPSVSVAVGALEAATTPKEVDPQQPSDICWNQVMYFKNVHDPETGEINAEMVEVFVHAVDPVTGISSCVAFGETPLGDDITAARVVNVYSTAPEDESGDGGDGDVGPCGQVLVKFAWVTDSHEEVSGGVDQLASTAGVDEDGSDNHHHRHIDDTNTNTTNINVPATERPTSHNGGGGDGPRSEAHGDNLAEVGGDSAKAPLLSNNSTNGDDAAHHKGDNDDDEFVLEDEHSDSEDNDGVNEDCNNNSTLHQPPANTKTTTLVLRPPQHHHNNNNNGHGDEEAHSNMAITDHLVDKEVANFTTHANNDDDVDDDDSVVNNTSASNVDPQTLAPISTPSSTTTASSSAIPAASNKPRPSIVLRFAPPPPPLSSSSPPVEESYDEGLDTPNYLTPIGTPRRHNNNNNNSATSHRRRFIGGSSRGNSPSPLQSPRPPKSPWYPAGKGAVDESHLPLAMRPSVIRQQEEILRLQKLLQLQQQQQDIVEEEEGDV